MEKMRIYVGGLGPGVQEDDLMKTFASMGRVESVEFNRNKGRSFGYMEFIPASDKALAKLFSAYNGCMWKGGKLKLEKAKEDYLSRLKREWAEDAELAEELASQKVDAAEKKPALPKSKEDQDFEKTQLKIFFPKLRKIKPLPLKGTGKHKYSFQRVEVPPLPVNFCDCAEHSRPPAPVKRNCTNYHEKVKRNYTNYHEKETYGVNEEETTGVNEEDTSGVNEEELHIMKSVLNKVLEKKNGSNTASDKAKFARVIHSITPSNDMQVPEDVGGQPSDEDDLLINIVGQSRNQVDLFDDWKPKINAKQDSLSLKMNSSTGSQKLKPMHDKKRKASASENHLKDNRSLKRTVKASPDDTIGTSVALNNVPTESGSTQLSFDPASVRKSAWKTLLTEKGSASFRLSDILPDHYPDELGTRSIAYGSNKDRRGDQPGKSEELENVPGILSSKSSASGEKSAAGPSRGDQSNKELESHSVAEPIRSSGSEIKARGPIQDDDERNINKEIEMVSVVELNKLSGSGTGPASVAGQDDPSGKSIAVEMLSVVEPNKSNLSENKSVGGAAEDDQSNKNKELEKLPAPEPNKSSESKNNSGRGASWLAKSSWMELVGDVNNSSFSISQILPGVTFEKQSSQQFGTNNNSYSCHENQSVFASKDKPHGRAKEASERDHTDPDGDKITSALVKKQDHIDLDGVQKFEQNDAPPASVRRSSSVSNKREIPDIVISETCPFMRNTASMKQWAKTKASLSGSLKRKGKGKGKETEEEE